MRKIISLNGDWNFYKGDIEVPRPVSKSAVYIQCKTERKHIGPAAYHYFDRFDCYYAGKEMKNIGWQVVQVPHDYIVDQDNDSTQSASNGYVKYENAWYRKSVDIGEEYIDKRILLQFDGIATQSIIYVNGSLLKRNFSAYNGIEIDITNYVYFDKPNVIAVYVNTDEFEGWWYQGGGIYRDTRLVITDKTAIDRYGVYVPYKKIDEENWEINFKTTVINTEFENQDITVISEVLDKENNVVASASSSAVAIKKDKTTVESFAVLKNPNLWNVDTPYLYTVKTTLLKNGETVDGNELKTGFRTVEISAEKGLLINGEKTYIYGVNGHQDFSLTGLVMPKSVAYYRTKLLKEMGANGYRTSHYQQTACILDSMDELGMLVMNENRWFVTSDENYEYLEDLIKRDRNRPSVIFWSTGNEEITHISPLGKKVNLDLTEFIRSLDNTRPITTCEDKIPTESTVFEDCDVISVNYNLASYDKIHEAHPDKVIFGTECCATGTTRDWHLPTNNNGRIKDEDKAVAIESWYQGRERTWKHIAERPYVSGFFQWAGFEYRGEAMWPRICSVSGAIDFYYQKKGAFYQNKSHWTTEPMIHIVQHWNFAGFEGKEIAIHIYTNCDEVELVLNGKSLGKKAVEKFTRSEWNVVYAAGELLAIGFKNGEKVCEHTRKTTGRPVGLKLTKMNDYEPNGKDVALFTCECVDQNGLTVPDAAVTVKFSSNEYCKILGTGSDHCDHNRISNTERKMYMGKITVALKPQWRTEKVELYAEADGLSTEYYIEKFEY